MSCRCPQGRERPQNIPWKPRRAGETTQDASFTKGSRTVKDINAIVS